MVAPRDAARDLHIQQPFRHAVTARDLPQHQPQRGAGLGFGLLDGLMRFDMARGLYPSKKWRLDLYLEAPI
jgi:hypothetical protein